MINSDVPTIFSTYTYPPDLQQSLIIWEYLSNNLAQSIALHWRKEFFANATTDFIISEENVDASTTLLYGTYALAQDSSQSRRLGRFSKSVELLVKYAIDTLGTQINQAEGTSIYTLNDFLDYTGYKISKFFIGLSSLTEDVSSNNIYTEGEWIFEADILDEESGSIRYHFELDVATDVNFTNILYSLDTETSQIGWYYLNSDNVFTAVSSAGVSSVFINSIIRYESTSLQLLSRGTIYYYRLRQKTTTSTYSYQRFSGIIYT